MEDYVNVTLTHTQQETLRNALDLLAPHLKEYDDDHVCQVETLERVKSTEAILKQAEAILKQAI